MVNNLISLLIGFNEDTDYLSYSEPDKIRMARGAHNAPFVLLVEYAMCNIPGGSVLPVSVMQTKIACGEVAERQQLAAQFIHFL